MQRFTNFIFALYQLFTQFKFIKFITNLLPAIKNSLNPPLFIKNLLKIYRRPLLVFKIYLINIFYSFKEIRCPNLFLILLFF
jgi:hypothetical protein